MAVVLLAGFTLAAAILASLNFTKESSFSLPTDQVSWLEAPESRAITSTITMTELLVLPYREGDEQRADDFYGLLSTYPNLDWIAPNLEIVELAARIRGLYRLRTPDALQAATAAHSQTTGLITNDAVFERVEGFQTLVLDSL